MSGLPAGEHLSQRVIEVDLRESGLLWLINSTVFHPRGFALGVDPGDGQFVLVGDGSAPHHFDTTDADVVALFRQVEALFERARQENDSR